MKNKIINILYVCSAVFVLLWLFTLCKHAQPEQVYLPELNLQEIEAQEQAQQQAEHAAAERARVRRIFSCETDEDCIIVDKDPCGCWAGPSGVTAINSARALEFNRLQGRALTKACPDGEPSKERECSPSARAVCQEKTCKIVY